MPADPRRLLVFAFAALIATAGCATKGSLKGAGPISPPPELCGNSDLDAGSFCMPVADIEAMLKQEHFDILGVKLTDKGTAGAMRMRISAEPEAGAAKRVFDVKWKEAPEGGEGMNNTPRKEIAAYAFQKLFMDPEDYVVPPTLGRCFSLEAYTAQVGPSTRTFKGSRCVYGVLAYWLQNVTDDDVRDDKRFKAEPAYRWSLSHMQLLTYLIDHRDTRDANFLISRDPQRPRVFSIDNGLAFGGLKNPLGYLVDQWSDIIIPGLARAQVERLRALTDAQLESLYVVAQYEIKARHLIEVTPTAPLNTQQGIRREGYVIQLGLTREEVDGIKKRRKKLLRRVDAGKIRLFEKDGPFPPEGS